MKNDEPRINIPLSDFCSSHLCGEWYREIPSHLALIVEQLSKNRQSYHIQWYDEEGKELHLPVLWLYNRWIESVEKYVKLKAEGEARRIAKFIYDANVKMLLAHIVKTMELDVDKAREVANNWMNNPNKIKSVGLKLKEKVEEV